MSDKVLNPAKSDHGEFVRKLFKHEPKTLWTMSALNSVIQHWVETEILIERAAKEQVELEGPKWTPKGDDEIGEFFAERDMARDLHDHTMIPIHRYSCIVMLFTTVERELKRLVENLEKQHGPQKLKVSDIKFGSYLAQANKFIDAFFNIRLSDCAQYEAMTDLQKVRNCIIHYQGEAGLAPDMDYLIQLRDRRKGFFAHPLTDIKIEQECLQQFSTEAWQFFTWIFNSLSWEIDSHYQGNCLDRHFRRIFKG
jgi:hypothetical protein